MELLAPIGMSSQRMDKHIRAFLNHKHEDTRPHLATVLLYSRGLVSLQSAFTGAGIGPEGNDLEAEVD
jgi:hypothetical protein